MPRVKRGVPARKRRKKILKQAKGYRGTSINLYKTARETVERALNYAYRDRRTKKRDFRSLWISRINAASRLNDLTYSQFIKGLKKSNIIIDRKLLADLAVSDPPVFSEISNVVRENV
jgi:large subunit ribosomal protein L20